MTAPTIATRTSGRVTIDMEDLMGRCAIDDLERAIYVSVSRKRNQGISTSRIVLGKPRNPSAEKIDWDGSYKLLSDN